MNDQVLRTQTDRRQLQDVYKRQLLMALAVGAALYLARMNN